MEDVGDNITEEAVALAGAWLEQANSAEDRQERAVSGRLATLVGDDSGVEFTMAYVDRVARHRSNRLAAAQLRELVAESGPPAFLGPVDRFMLRVGARIAPIVPWLVMPIARRRMRQLVGRLVVDAEPDALHPHLAEQRKQSFALNVNLLGEAVMGETEADSRLQRTLDLIDQPDVDYVSVKISSITSQIDLWSFDESLHQIKNRLEQLLSRSATSHPPTFVNLDMEEYHDLELTMRAFMELLERPEFRELSAGIVLQTYLPESFDALTRLVGWANDRGRNNGGDIKIRLVKGANLATERVDAAMHNWTQAPYGSKAEVDANYKRCVDWVLTTDRTRSVKVGVASHNLFDIAWASLLAGRRGVSDRVGFEMLQGMAPSQSRTVRDDTGNLLLYTPIVEQDSFDVAISYLIRRLEENTTDDNFLRHLFGLRVDSEEFVDQADRFRRSVADRHTVSGHSLRRGIPAEFERGFTNHPDSDPTQPQVQEWISEIGRQESSPCTTEMTTDPTVIDRVVAEARDAQLQWWDLGAVKRREILWTAAEHIDARRGELLATMADEAAKVLSESDSEVTEAIDFARWYADRGLELGKFHGATFTPLGVVAVIPPWNFPVAIPAGGTFAALAAGNSVVLKPTLETPRCAEILAEALWDAGVPRDVLQFVRTPDDDCGAHLICSVDGVILTGSWETAQMFQTWKPDMKLLAETSGKNALVVTPHADFDLAVADLVASAFGHSGQKCSAASLAILVGSTYDSSRFRRQLLDAAASLRIGAPRDPATRLGPTIQPVEGKLRRALDTLDQGETWLLEPRQLDGSGALWSPGIKFGVQPGSWFHQTECFGPVLGLIRADTIDDAISIQNSSAYGLTAGIHSLDHTEIARWTDRIEAGNAYVNRGITGAIVNRQPFGGWKRSSIGPGAKAGGADYLLQLGEWTPRESTPETEWNTTDDDTRWWESRYGRTHDPSGLFCEANQLRYLPIPDMVLRFADETIPIEIRRTLAAVTRANPATVISVDPGTEHPARQILNEGAGLSDGVEIIVESESELAGRLGDLRWGRVRMVGRAGPQLVEAAKAAEVTLITETVTPSGRLELRHYLREQVVSRTLHRFGNVARSDQGSATEQPVYPAQ